MTSDFDRTKMGPRTTPYRINDGPRLYCTKLSRDYRNVSWSYIFFIFFATVTTFSCQLDLFDRDCTLSGLLDKLWSQELDWKKRPPSPKAF